MNPKLKITRLSIASSEVNRRRPHLLQRCISVLPIARFLTREDARFLTRGKEDRVLVRIVL